MRVYVTGANGYLGAHVIHKLENRGHEVLGFDSHGALHHLSPPLTNADLSIDKCHAVVPLGWYSAVGNQYPQLQEESYKRVASLLNYVAEIEHIRVVFPSSAAVYGHQSDRLINERAQLYGRCEYSRAKVRAEQMIQNRLQDRYTIFRFGSMMGLGRKGERTKRELVVNAFAIDGYTKRRIDVWNAQDYKPVIHVLDAADLIVSAVECPKLYEGIYNASVTSWRAIDIAHAASRITGAKVDIINTDREPRSCNLDSRALIAVHNTYPSFRKIGDAIKEFSDYVETVNDKNIPWVSQIKELT